MLARENRTTCDDLRRCDEHGDHAEDDKKQSGIDSAE